MLATDLVEVASASFIAIFYSYNKYTTGKKLGGNKWKCSFGKQKKGTSDFSVSLRARFIVARNWVAVLRRFCMNV